jgi:hypothetical protein
MTLPSSAVTRDRAIALARGLDALEGEDVASMDDDNFVCFLLNEAPWRTVLEVTWSAGSFASVDVYEGLFVGRDDAETHGPFSSFAEAKRHLQISEAFDRTESFRVDPTFADQSHDLRQSTAREISQKT